MRSKPANAIRWTKDMEEFLILNFQKLTNKQLADAIGLRLTTTRGKLISLGLKRMEMEYWTDEQVKFLKVTYREIGDKELSEIFQAKWPKNKGWTLKHIEKKRMYLKLRRTKKQLKAIKERNRLAGCWQIGNQNMWATRGVAPVGTLKQWGNYVYVKLEDRYEKLHRAIWEQHYGAIPPDMNVVRKNSLLPADDISNLELITNAELAARNSINRYPIEIRETIKVINQLNNKIKTLSDEK